MTHALDTVDGLVALLQESRQGGPNVYLSELRSGRMHCTTCSREMTMIVVALYMSPGKSGPHGMVMPHDRRTLPPSLFQSRCVHCESTWTVVAYRAPDETSLAIFGDTHGGLSTPHTPGSVAYYLDQAYKAQAASAHSAAVAMYRAALEHLLYQQGYHIRELGRKIEALEKAIVAGTAPTGHAGWTHATSRSSRTSVTTRSIPTTVTLKDKAGSTRDCWSTSKRRSWNCLILSMKIQPAAPSDSKNSKRFWTRKRENVRAVTTADPQLDEKRGSTDPRQFRRRASSAS